MLHPIEWATIAVITPLVVYAVFRAAATGWYGVKFHYHRRLIDGIQKGDDNHG